MIAANFERQFWWPVSLSRVSLGKHEFVRESIVIIRSFVELHVYCHLSVGN